MEKIGTKLGAQPREEQSEEVINLRDGGHRALAAAARIALFDAHGWRNSGDETDVRPRHLFHKLPRVGIHRIEKSPLAFGKNQVKRERAFARTAHAGHNHKLSARNDDREIFQIVLARAMDGDGVGSGAGLWVGVQHGFA